MSWRQTRPCDGSCCTESPRFPTRDGKSCVYLDPEMSLKRCMVQTGYKVAPDDPCPALPILSGKEAVQETCVDWPHNIKKPRIGQAGNCCWEWVE